MTEDAVLNEHDAAMMLLALSGREARSGPNREGLLDVQNRTILVGKRLEFVKEEIRLMKLQTPPRTNRGNKQLRYWLQRDALQKEVVTLEALLFSLKVEGQFLAANPYSFSLGVHTSSV
jgi:hypothetical protein